jgi:hypothetical protein
MNPDVVRPDARKGVGEDRAMVMAGFVKEVEAVNESATPVHAATNRGASSAPRHPKTIRSNPNVAH